MEHALTDRKERILNGVEALLFEQGFNRVTTDEIAEAVGISKKTLYAEFRSKSSLVQALVRRKLAHIDTAFASLDDGDPLIAFVRLVGRELNGIGRRFLSDLSRFEPELWHEVEMFRRVQIQTRFQDRFERAQAQGVFREDVDPRVLTAMMVAVAEALLRPEALVSIDLNPSAVIAQVQMILGEGVRPRNEEKRHD